MTTVRPPTAHEQACWDALHEHRSTARAARALGKSTAAVRVGVLAYMSKKGLDGPIPYTIPRNATRAEDLRSARIEAERLRERVRLLEAENARLRELAHPWVAVHAKLDAILARPSAVAVTHRRIADGGQGGRAERKALRPTG
jgi:hypothetical protein